MRDHLGRQTAYLAEAEAFLEVAPACPVEVVGGKTCLSLRVTATRRSADSLLQNLDASIATAIQAAVETWGGSGRPGHYFPLPRSSFPSASSLSLLPPAPALLQLLLASATCLLSGIVALGSEAEDIGVLRASSVRLASGSDVPPSSNNCSSAGRITMIL